MSQKTSCMNGMIVIKVKVSVFFCAFLSLILSAATAQEKKPEDFVKFKQNSKDFGKIKQGQPVSFEFVFDNISNEDLVIEEVLPPCSCTIVSKPEGKIVKGKI
jgi:hypothetical protein